MKVLRTGSTGDDVLAWENFLVGQSYYTGEVDGRFDEATTAATKQFQVINELPDDGVVGPLTWSKAIALGFPGIEDDSTGSEGPNWPLPPTFGPLYGAARDDLLGKMGYIASGTPANPEAITILGGWASDNIVSVEVPQLVGIKGAPTSCKIDFHKVAAEKLQQLFTAWAEADLIDRILTWDGGWAPRFIRGSRTTLSNHCLPAHETVWTLEGPAAIADLKGYSGSVWSFDNGVAVPGKVTRFFENGRKPLLRISLMGHVLHCTHDHPVLVMRKKTLPKSEWVQHTFGRGQKRALYWTEMIRADALRVGDHVVRTRGLPEPSAPSAVNLDWAEILGLFLGDGYVVHRDGMAEGVCFCFPVGDRIRQHAMDVMTRYFGRCPTTPENGKLLAYYTSDVFQQFLPYDRRALEKDLPREVWNWPSAAKVRLALGLLYSDGTIVQSKSSTGGGYGARYSFKLGSRNLTNSTRMLLATLGFKVSKVSEIPPEEMVICGVSTKTSGHFQFFAIDVLGVLRPEADPMYIERVTAAIKPSQGDSHCYGYEAVAPDFTHVVVRKIEDDGYADVYDLTVADHHNFVTGGVVVSNCYGTAFDINAQWNWLGATPALKGKQGSVRELVELANQHGWYWGGHYGKTLNEDGTVKTAPGARLDGMHFELAIP